MFPVLVSVIIPNYNHAAYLVQRIESVLSQTCQNFEVILLDDCSTDDSRAIMERYRSHPKVSYVIFNEKNSGSPFKQWVKGFAMAKGEMLWIAESDDYAAPEFLEKCLRKMELSSSDFVHTDSAIVDENGRGTALYSQSRNNFFKSNLWSQDHSTLPGQTILDYNLYRCIVNNTSSALFKRKLIEGLDTQKLGSYRNAGDLFFFGYILTKTSCSYIAEPLNFYRHHGENTTTLNSKTGLVKKEAYEILTHQILHYPALDTLQVAKLRTALKYVLLFFGKQSFIEMSIRAFTNELSTFVKAGLLSVKEACSLFVHIQYEKLNVPGMHFLSTTVLETDSWRKIKPAG